MNDAVMIVESHFGIKMIQVGSDEYRSLNGCPWCGDGGKGKSSDRFRLFVNGATAGPRVWCRKCGRAAFVDALDGVGQITKEELEVLRLAAEERKRVEKEKQKSALAHMASCRDHLLYHANLVDKKQGAAYWAKEGIGEAAIREYKLGYCPQCPTAPYSASFTIPVMAGGVLYDIRHRLESPNGEGKYRRHIAGLPHMLFHMDALKSPANNIVIVEGEKKGIVLESFTGLNYVSTMGMCSFKQAWVPRFDVFKTVYVVLDPGAEKQAVEIAGWFNGRGRVVNLPVKADDFFVSFGGTKSGFMDYLAQARPI